MNYRIKISGIDEIISIKDSYTPIFVRNKTIFKSLALEPLENIILFNDNRIIELDKYVTIISDLFKIELNDNKIIKSLYKKIEINIDKYYEKEKRIINELILELISYNQIEFGNLEFNNTLDIGKLLSNYSIKYEEVSKDNYLNYILKYIKIQAELLGIKAVITYGLINLLNADEISQIAKELDNIGVILVDIIPGETERMINSVEIDEDYCII